MSKTAVKNVDPRSLVIIGIDTKHTEYGKEVTATAHPLFDPRINLAAAETDAKCSNVKEFGVLEPVQVVETDDGVLEVVSGRQRVKQARMAGLEVVPAMVSKKAYSDLAIQNLISNANRTESHFFTDGDNITMLKDQEGLSRKQIATIYGWTVGKVDRYLQVAKLTDAQREFITEEGMSFSAAHAYKGQSAESKRRLEIEHAKKPEKIDPAETEEVDPDDTFLDVDGDAPDGATMSKKEVDEEGASASPKLTAAGIRNPEDAPRKSMIKTRSEMVEEMDLLKNKAKQCISKGEDSSKYTQMRVALSWCLGDVDGSLVD